MLNRWTKTAFTAILMLFILNTWFGLGQVRAWKHLTKKERPTFSQIRDAAQQFYTNFGEGRKPGYKQFNRWLWFARNRLNQDGYFDPSLNWKGWLEKNRRFGSNVITEGSDWKSVGPFTKSGIAGLGRLNCIAFDPINRDTLWVGAPTGGLWKSEDAGQSWSTTTDSLPNLGVSSIAIYPENPDIMYIATGDKQRGSALSIGIMKSTDRGQSWQITGLNPDTSDAWKISKVIIHPTHSNVLLTATNNGIYKTGDGGTTWEQMIGGDFHDLEIHPSNPGIWFGAKHGDGVYKSTDTGENWVRLGNGLPSADPGIGRIVLAVSLSTPETVYAVYSKNIISQGWIWGLYGVYRSLDGGSTWSLQSNSPNLLGWNLDGSDSGGQGGYALVLDIKPDDPNVIYVGSVNLWRSDDGGVTWQIIARTVHVDHHDLGFLPGSPSTLFTCNDGGLHRSDDGGDSWTDISDGLVIHQVYRLALSPQFPDMLVLGAQDNGSSLHEADSGWQGLYGGDGSDCLIDPSDHQIIYCASQWGNFVRSPNGGQDFSTFFGGAFGSKAWLAPLEVDPTAPDVLYTASNMIWRSTGGMGVTTASYALTSEPIRILAISPAGAENMWASDGERLFRTGSNGETWTELDNSLFLPFITGIAIHPNSPEKVWITLGGYGRWNSRFAWFHLPYETEKPKVFHTQDGGSSWQDVSGALPNIPVNCIVIDPFSLGVYLGTDLGIFYSESGTGDWQRFDNGLPNVIVTDMKIHKTEGKIVAATYGRGVWESPLASSPQLPGIYPPLYFRGSVEENRSLFQVEYINRLSWIANPVNELRSNFIDHYRLYRVSDGSRQLLAEVDGNTFQFLVREPGDGETRYGLTAVAADGSESEMIYRAVRR